MSTPKQVLDLQRDKLHEAGYAELFCDIASGS